MTMEQTGEPSSKKHMSFEEIPIVALRSSTCRELALALNAPKVIPTEEGVLRDWRGLAELMGLDTKTIRLLESKHDPVSGMISMWNERDTFENLKSHLVQMDRYDVLDDIMDLLVQDASHYLQKRDGGIGNPNEIDRNIESSILTIGDSMRLERGLPVEKYDAFLLHAKEDADFAAEIVDKLEGNYGMKLCLRERDLVGGLVFEHEAITRLIDERCNRLIVIFSPNFINSKANQFFLLFAQALGIEQRRRKIIPCIYKHCELPATIRCAFCLDYTRSGKLWNFWEKLRDSLQATPHIKPLESIKGAPKLSLVKKLVNSRHKESEELKENPPLVTEGAAPGLSKKNLPSVSNCESSPHDVPVAKSEESNQQVKADSCNVDSGLCSQLSCSRSGEEKQADNIGKRVQNGAAGAQETRVSTPPWFKFLLPKQVAQKDKKRRPKKLVAE